MAKAVRNKFLLSIILPSVIAVAMFIVSFYLVLVPLFEKNMMDRKKEMISELTNTALSLVDEYYNDYRSGILGEEEAKRMAAVRIGEMRYGDERKDYFWITDMRPFMIMHPYRKELIGTNLQDYTDPDGKKLFVEAVELVRENGEGFINYKWQWKDDTTQVVPKLSYVKGFSKWQWIIGTGIYLEDVKQEIKTLERNLLWISFIIILVIAVILFYINRQSIIIEGKRREAENKLLQSRQKYKSLVEASTEGTLMVAERKLIYVNQRFLDLTGYERKEILEKEPEDIFKINWDDLKSSFVDPGRSLSFESEIKRKDHEVLQVVISASRVRHNKGYGYILTVKELSRTDILEKEKERLDYKIQNALLLMNQQIAALRRDIICCSADTSIEEAAKLMKRKKAEVIYIEQDGQILGVAGPADFLFRQVAEKLRPDQAVTKIMSAPVLTIKEDELISEALLKCKTGKVSHLLIIDREGRYSGQLSYKNLLEAQQNYTGMLRDEIAKAETSTELASLYQRMNALINAFIASGVKTASISKVIALIADSINARVIELAIEKTGSPPCEFCFMAMGSQGRDEQTLSTDQDNGIIIDDKSGDEKSVTDYFVRLGKEVNDALHQVGYNYCPGDFMAGNPEWSLKLSHWKELFTGWINNSDPQSLLDISIFFDFRDVYGSDGLARELREHINNITEEKAVFFYHLSQTITRYKIPVDLFGRIVGESDTADSNIVDLKKLLLPLTGFARIYALKLKITETNTLARLGRMRGAEGLSDEFLDEVVQAYNVLMNLRLSHQVRQLMEGEEPGNSIDVNRLTDIERSTLKKVLSVLNDIILKLKSDFKGVM